MSSITYCTRCVDPGQGDASRIISGVTQETTPNQLDIMLKSFPRYTFDQGGQYGQTLLARAAQLGNLKLIVHIVRKGGNGLLDLGNVQGDTPLFAVASCQNPQRAVLAARTLLNLGANVNIASRLLLNAGIPEKQSMGPTVLEEVASCTNNMDLIKLFLQKGAVLSRPIHEPALSRIEQALRELNGIWSRGR